MRSALCLLFLAPLCARAESTDLLDGAVEARRVVERAVEVYGGVTRLRADVPTDISLATDFAPYGQNRDSDVIERGLASPNRMLFDPATQRIRFDNESRFHGGYAFRSRTVLDATGGVTENLSHMGPGEFITTVDAAALLTTRMNYLWLMPHAIALETLDRSASAVVRGHVGGETIVDYSRVNGTQVALYFDERTGLLSHYQLAVDHPVLGDTVATVSFDGYHEDHGLTLPSERVQKLGDIVIRRDRYAFAWTKVTDADFVKATPPATPAVTPPNGWDKLGKGVFLLRNYSGYNALAVEFDDHVVVVEAPIDSNVTRLMLDRIAKELNKPVARLVLTHHHADHSGGVREYVAAGIPVTTTAGNRAHFERVASAPHRLRPDAQARNPKPIKLDLVDGRRTFSDDSQKLEVVSVGKNAHVEELLVVWIPSAGVLFQGDLLILPDQGTSPAIEVNRDLAKLLEREGWQPKAIAGAHGRVGTLEDLEATLETH